MKTPQEIKKWILENCVDRYGYIRLAKLDFSDFNGNVYIGEMKVQKDLLQDNQIVGGTLYQDLQKVGKILYQNKQEVKQVLYQGNQIVGIDLYQDNQVVEGNLHKGYNTVKGYTYDENNDDWSNSGMPRLNPEKFQKMIDDLKNEKPEKSLKQQLLEIVK